MCRISLFPCHTYLSPRVPPQGMGVSDDASDAAVEDEEDRDAAMAQRKAAEEDEAEFQVRGCECGCV